MPKVTLITYTPQAEKTIATAAKLCYSASSIEEINQQLSEEKSNDFIEMLSEIGHESPIEHASFTFGIEDVSRTFLAQITRHRIGSYSVQSQRYVKEKNFDYVTPPEIAKDENTKALFDEAMKACDEYYIQLTTLLFERHVKQAISDGMEEKHATRFAEKKAIEDARFVLPNACETKMVVTMNARSLQNFFRLRCCNRAQWEIRDVATQMLALVYEVAPALFKHSGPACVSGACSEGKMCCLKTNEVRAFFDELKK